ncbi:MAG: WD40 repeat domain-containing protein, partial [Myxococcota bacterium]
TTAAYAPIALQSTGVVGLSWGRELVAAGGNRTGRIRPDGHSDRLQGGPSLPQTKSAAALPSGEVLIGTLRGVFVDEGDQVRRLPGDGLARRVLPMADEHMLLLGDPTLLWHPTTDQKIAASGSPIGLEGAVSPEGRTAVFLTKAQTLVRLDLNDPPTWTELGAHTVTAVAPGPKGWPIYLGTADGLDVLGADGVRAPWASTGKPITDIAVSPDGRLVAATDTAHRAWVWRAKDGALLARLQGHTRRMSAVAFSPGGTHLATGSWDDTIRFWDVSRIEQPVAELQGTIERGWGVSAPP